MVESICDLLDDVAPVTTPRHRADWCARYVRRRYRFRRDLITFVADRPGHDRRYAIDASKLERDLGWRAKENFESGIEKTVRWYVDQQPWWRAILERGYTANRVGLSG